MINMIRRWYILTGLQKESSKKHMAKNKAQTANTNHDTWLHQHVTEPVANLVHHKQHVDHANTDPNYVHNGATAVDHGHGHVGGSPISPDLSHASYGDHNKPNHDMYGATSNPGARDGSNDANTSNEPLRHVDVPHRADATPETDAAIKEVIAAGQQAAYDAGIPIGHVLNDNNTNLNKDHLPL
jgi:hypothetical protein